MARRSLRPQLNQIRQWVRQGRTDAWIAHQLEVTTAQIASFKRENDLVADDVDTDTGADFDDEIDLRAEDDALIAAELEAAQAAKAKAEAEAAEAKAKEEAARAKARKNVDGVRRRRGRRQALSPPRSPWWSWSPQGLRRPARGLVRPRRGGLRTVARPRRPGRPDLRRALGGPPSDRDHDRGRPDRDPPRRRRRRRRIAPPPADAGRGCSNRKRCNRSGAGCTVTGRRAPARRLAQRSSGCSCSSSSRRVRWRPPDQSVASRT